MSEVPLHPCRRSGSLPTCGISGPESKLVLYMPYSLDSSLAPARFRGGYGVTEVTEASNNVCARRCVAGGASFSQPADCAGRKPRFRYQVTEASSNVCAHRSVAGGGGASQPAERAGRRGHHRLSASIHGLLESKDTHRP